MMLRSSKKIGGVVGEEGGHCIVCAFATMSKLCDNQRTPCRKVNVFLIESAYTALLRAGLSTYLPLRDKDPVSDENRGTPVLMCHGDAVSGGLVQ